MARIENVLKEYVKGTFDIVLEPNEQRDYPLEFTLKITVEDVDDLLAIKSEVAKEQADTKKALSEQTTVLRKILERSYPLFESEQIEGLLAKEKSRLLLEIQFACEIADRDAYEALLKAKKRQLEKYSNGEKTE